MQNGYRILVLSDTPPRRRRKIVLSHQYSIIQFKCHVSVSLNVRVGYAQTQRPRKLMIYEMKGIVEIDRRVMDRLVPGAGMHGRGNGRQ